MSEAQTVELALRDEPQAVMLTMAQLRLISKTDFVPKSMRNNVGAVLACVARGRAMGIPDMVALNGIAIIEGKATLSAELMCAIVRAHGHSITGDVGADSATVKGRRRDNGDEMTATFTLEMAKTAGLDGKANWKHHPDDMLWARAVSKLCRRLFADCFAGGTYTPEDVDIADDDLAELTADEVLDEGAVSEDTSDGESAGLPGSPISALVEQLLALAPDGKRDEWAMAIRKNDEAHPLDKFAHKAWLEQQLEKAREATGAAA